MRKLLCILMVLSMIFCLYGCKNENSTKIFEYNGLEITLPDDFKDKNDGYMTLYNENIKIVIVSTPTSAIGNISLEEYAKLLSDSMEFLTEVSETDTFSYEYSISGENFEESKSVLALYKSDEYYYDLTFTCDEKDFEAYKSQFLEWMQSVHIK